MAQTFGRGVMTNHWNDVANSDYIMVIAGNPAENHPAAYGHITKAVERGAKLIVVDPRFTRSASKAHIYCPIRSGTDVGFIGGMIKYVIDDMVNTDWANYNKTYLVEYTNASYLVNADFKGPADLDGLFVDYDAAKRTYGKTKWTYQTDAATGIPLKDKTLQDPNCVFQIVKKHFARYTPEMVNRICGTPVEKFLEVARTFSESGAASKAGNIMYAMGATHHTNGVQIIRSYGILQLLLGNVGIAGGGIQAMRGESNVQGSTDAGLLFGNLTGYLNAPVHTDETLQAYLTRTTPVTKEKTTDSLNFWGNTNKFMVSLLKAWRGDAATSTNDFAFHDLPKYNSSKNHSLIALFEAMEKGDIKGLMCWGMNPAVGSPNAEHVRTVLANLDWLVCTDLWETETSIFWKRPGAVPADINTEVFLLPAAGSFEKEGSVTNSSRWMQWRDKCADPPGEARTDLDMIDELMVEIRRLYKDGGGQFPEGILNLTWDYGSEVDPSQVAKEMNGYYLSGEKKGQLVNGFANLLANGTTSCGSWIYCGCYVGQESLDAFEKKHLTGEVKIWPDDKFIGNRAARRYPVDVGNVGYDAASGYKEIGLYSYWAWCWPVNRRIVYNRASVDLAGNPWDTEHPVLFWDNTNTKWIGDVVDGSATSKPMSQGGQRPFIMRSEGHSCLFAPNNGNREASLVDGPFPEHYEPWESPLPVNPLSGKTKDEPGFSDPAFKIWRPSERSDPSEYPIVASTYRVVEHWQAGQMSRNLPWLVEQMPNMFVEMSEELADSLEPKVKNGDEVKVWNTRGEITAVAVVTKRLKPFQMNGTTVHQIGMPWHWGYSGLSTGDSANVLTPSVGDANTMCPEFKAFLCNVRRA